MYRDTCSPVYLLNIRIERPNITVKTIVFGLIFRRWRVCFQVDRDSVNLIADNQMWGDILIRYRVNQEDWNMLETGLTRRTCINKIHMYILIRCAICLYV